MAVSTGSEAVIVVGAGVGTFYGNNDAAVLSAFGMGGSTATEIGVTFVRTRSGDGGAGVAQTSEMCVAGVTAEEGIAGIGAGSWKGDTGSALAFRVLSAIHNAVTSIGTGALDSDTGLPFADGVGKRSTTDDRIALIGAEANDRDAGITLTFGVFVTVDAVGTFVGTGAVLSETGTGCSADEVILACTVGVCGAGIGAGPLESDAGVVLTSGVGNRSAALGWLAGTGARAGQDHAGGALAFRMLETTYFRGAGICAEARDGNALIACITFIVELSAAAKNDVTLIDSCTGNDEAGGVVCVTSCVLICSARNQRRTFVRAGGSSSDALPTGITHRLLGTATNKGIAFVRPLSGDDDAGSEVCGADSVLSTSVCGRAVIRASTGDFDALILSIADHVSAGAAVIDERIALIYSCTGNGDAGGVIGVAFCVFVSFDALRVVDALILSSSIHGDTGVALADVMLLAVVVGDAFVIAVSGDDDTGC